MAVATRCKEFGCEQPEPKNITSGATIMTVGETTRSNVFDLHRAKVRLSEERAAIAVEPHKYVQWSDPSSAVITTS